MTIVAVVLALCRIVLVLRVCVSLAAAGLPAAERADPAHRSAGARASSPSGWTTRGFPSRPIRTWRTRRLQAGPSPTGHDARQGARGPPPSAKGRRGAAHHRPQPGHLRSARVPGHEGQAVRRQTDHRRADPRHGRPGEFLRRGEFAQAPGRPLPGTRHLRPRVRP